MRKMHDSRWSWEPCHSLPVARGREARSRVSLGDLITLTQAVSTTQCPRRWRRCSQRRHRPNAAGLLREVELTSFAKWDQTSGQNLDPFGYSQHSTEPRLSGALDLDMVMQIVHAFHDTGHA